MEKYHKAEGIFCVKARVERDERVHGNNDESCRTTHTVIDIRKCTCDQNIPLSLDGQDFL